MTKTYASGCYEQSYEQRQWPRVIRNFGKVWKFKCIPGIRDSEGCRSSKQREISKDLLRSQITSLWGLFSYKLLLYRVHLAHLKSRTSYLTFFWKFTLIRISKGYDAFEFSKFAKILNHPTERHALAFWQITRWLCQSPSHIFPFLYFLLPCSGCFLSCLDSELNSKKKKNQIPFDFHAG